MGASAPHPQVGDRAPTGSSEELPVRLESRTDGTPWIVRGTVDDKGLCDFVLSFHAPKTRISTAVLGEPASDTGQHRTIELGTLKLNVDGVQTQTIKEGANPTGVTGALGRDVLDRMAVGFDNESGAIWLWPRGARAEAAKAWIEAGPTTGLDRKGIRVGRLRRYGGDLLGFDAEVGGKRMGLALYPGIDFSALEQKSVPVEASALVSVPPNAVAEILGVLTLGPFISEAAGTFGVRGRLVTGDRFSQNSVAGLVNPDQLSSRRVVVDLPSSSLYTEDLDADSLVAFRLSRANGISLSVERGKIVIRRKERPLDWLAPYQGCEVTSINGQRADEVLSILRRGGKPAQELLAATEREKIAGTLLVVEGPKGSVTFNPLGRNIPK